MATLTINSRCHYATMKEWSNPGSTPASHQVIVPGVVVDYIAHVPGGMVKVRHNGQDVVIHPGATKELGDHP